MTKAAPHGGDGEDALGAIVRNARRDVAMPAFAIRSDGTSEQVELSNLSYEGCRIAAEPEHPFALGERLSLSVVRLGQVEAEVRWVADRCAGAKFLG